MSVKQSHDTLLEDLLPGPAIKAISSGEKLEWRSYPALGVVMIEMMNLEKTLKSDGFEEVQSRLEVFNSQVNQVSE